MLGLALTAGATGCDFISTDSVKDLEQTVATVAVEEYPVILRLALECIFAKATVILYNKLTLGFGHLGLVFAVKQEHGQQNAVGTVKFNVDTLVGYGILRAE